MIDYTKLFPRLRFNSQIEPNMQTQRIVSMERKVLLESMMVEYTGERVEEQRKSDRSESLSRSNQNYIDLNYEFRRFLKGFPCIKDILKTIFQDNTFRMARSNVLDLIRDVIETQTGKKNKVLDKDDIKALEPYMEVFKTIFLDFLSKESSGMYNLKLLLKTLLEEAGFNISLMTLLLNFYIAKNLSCECCKKNWLSIYRKTTQMKNYTSDTDESNKVENEGSDKRDILDKCFKKELKNISQEEYTNNVDIMENTSNAMSNTIEISPKKEEVIEAIVREAEIKVSDEDKNSQEQNLQTIAQKEQAKMEQLEIEVDKFPEKLLEKEKNDIDDLLELEMDHPGFMDVINGDEKSERKEDAEFVNCNLPLYLTEEHEKMLAKIVRAIGRNHWQEVTKLLIAAFKYEVPFDINDRRVVGKLQKYYEMKLNWVKNEPVTINEDKCIIFMYKYWRKTMNADILWSNIARHLEGRTGDQIKNYFKMKIGSENDISLVNMDNANPASVYFNLSHMFSLTIVRKNLDPIMDVTTRLQYEDNFLVMGTSKEIFMMRCQDSAIKCFHPGVVPYTFKYDPSRPEQQFVNFVKLTFGNGLKKLGLLDDPNTFDWNTIEYRGDSIHKIVSKEDKERFCVPRNCYILINNELEIRTKRKYVRREEKMDLHELEKQPLMKIRKPRSGRRAKYPRNFEETIKRDEMGRFL